MDTQEIDKTKMDALKELADTNIKISAAKATLFKMQEDETFYLQEREQKALNKINQLLDDSKEILDKTKENYNEIHILCQEVSGFCDFLVEYSGKFTELLADFNFRSETWDKEVEKQRAEFAEIKKGLDLQSTINENEREKNKKEWQKIIEAKKLIESRQQQIKVALEVLNKKQNG